MACTNYFGTGGTYAWAPDNDTIYIPENQDPEFNIAKVGIYAVSLSTKQKRPVLLSGKHEITEHLTCSPDGKRLAFPRCPPSPQISETWKMSPQVWPEVLSKFQQGRT